jgi:site-specific recombinase XerD
VDPLDATPENLARYERRVAGVMSEATKRRLSLKTHQERVRTVRTAYAFLVDEGLIDASPARHVKVRGRTEPKRTFPSDAQAAALLGQTEGPGLVEARDWSLLTVLLHTALRAAEAAGLTWADVAEGGEPCVTVEGKGRVVRTVPLSAAAVRALAG